jgi:S1-C subfamily serine protease
MEYAGAKGAGTGTDAKDDVALLRLTGASGLSTVMPDTDGASVGDPVTAVGDADGEVVGMTTASSTGADIDGYAVPIAKVMSIVDDLDSGVTTSRYEYDLPAFLGIGLSETNATVTSVYADTPAAEAGLEAGDRITAIGSTEAATTAQLQAAVADLSPGDRLDVTRTDRTGASRTRSVTLVTGPVE